MSLINYSEETSRELQGSIKIINFIVSICAFTLFLRMFYLQIWKGNTFQRFSDQNRLKKVVLRAPRGYILDRNKKIIVDNTIDFDVSITPYYVRDRDTREKTFNLLNKFLPNAKNYLEEVDRDFDRLPSFQSIKVKKQITRDELAFIETYRDELPGVDVDVEMKRIYQMKNIGSQVMGHLSEVSKDDLA